MNKYQYENVNFYTLHLGLSIWAFWVFTDMFMDGFTVTVRFGFRSEAVAIDKAHKVIDVIKLEEQLEDE